MFIEKRSMAFRLKDKMVIPDLLELADMESLRTIIERVSDEETPLDQRLQRILGSIQSRENEGKKEAKGSFF